MGGACSIYRGVERCIQALMVTAEGTIPLGRSRRGREDNIKMNLQKMGWEGMDGIDVAHDKDRQRALVNAVMSFRVPQNGVNFLTT